MPAKKTVLESINLPGDGRCVDIFMRPDGTYGFEEFRRDIEDGRGWFPIGHFGGRVFNSQDQATRQALAEIAWLATVLEA